jgi:hypothetical protein
MAGCLSRNEGLLTAFSFFVVYGIALYAIWKTSLPLLFLFILANLTAWVPYRRKVCPHCENICPFNPDKKIWKG